MADKRRSLEVLPHDWIFGAYLAVMWVLLVLKQGFTGRDTLVYLGLILADAGLIAMTARWRSPAAWRVRLLFYPLAMNICFQEIRTAVPAIQPQRKDSFLEEVDQRLIGANLSLRAQALYSPWLTEVLSACYMLFFPYLLFSMIWYLCGSLALLKKFYAGLFTLYGIGFLGYLLVPAVGPYVAMADQFHRTLEGLALTRWNDRIVRLGSNGVDVFPSLHCAVSMYILLFDRRHMKWRFWSYLVPCVGLWTATIYLRYHYFIDMVAGFVLAAPCLWLAHRWSPRQEKEAPRAVPLEV